MKVLLFPVLLAAAIATAPPKAATGTRWTGVISNGMKGDKISFTVSPDGKKIANFTFDGYWRCGGKLERQVVGPEGSFAIKEGKVSGVAVKSPHGSATAWRFAIEGGFAGKTAANGMFRMNINTVGCDTYALQWSAKPVQ
ncbi:hypothetical protein [Hymenobacter glacieicola]|uniref:DUF2147 domain-containing protein n=1 Tax=Hymenobacter glacieicola TaxID=1562124 RepID=A0ABQ1WT81_9BACT|nr:hypothetical protein [Hymenobacter glacieicola]GGG44616.1 hypothetical protein GCM10011378_21180 [Hymenobacter glacieicola]